MNYLLIFIFLWIQNPFMMNEKGSIHLTIDKVESDQGVIRILVFSSSDGFPENRDHAIKAISLPIENGQASTQIKNLPKGKYAISVFHDQDKNGKMKKNALGYPQEKYGFSNNPNNRFSIPKFDRCAVSLSSNQVKKVEIKLR
ncbi:DUF2141 domain-containing protein [Algoriphagus hitonicola]|uniref:Uncharacterized conserved protein, DUF2141 family n=1 Tax=Algoriphagus hitonicola TaxID=435880 RepID=A0A1I2VPI3_9BACT|nr:DUF2141 domain-containing protein [Algoriphagus hitonicola]SFG91225.1 Uncharacterized conserved protein, DUF2141 family [Algoriphagus hitonicola]